MASSASPHHRIGYLGPAGTFTEQALLSQPDLAAAERLGLATIAGVLQDTHAGKVDFGFVAIENALEGTVSHTIDTLAFSTELLIQREVDLPLKMQLLAPAGVDIGAITQIHSHPMAFGQCRDWVQANVPNAEIVAATSTAGAVQEMANRNDGISAAIANSLAGELYGAVALASDIADHKGNLTRFVLVGREGIPAPTGHDKTSMVVFQRADRPGSLLAILQEFAARSINLSKLESRPTKAGIGDYCFILDLNGHIADELVADCLRNVRAKGHDIKFLGSYPAVGDAAQDTRREVDAAWTDAQSWMDTLRSCVENS